MHETLISERDGAVAVVRLNRPEVGNTLSVRMLGELTRLCAELDADESVRVIILTGEGKLFSAGTDLSGKGTTWSEQDGWDEGGALDLRALATPVIAAVQGSAVGAGLSIAVSCDIRVVAEDAKLGFVFVRRGIVADDDLHWWLPRIIGQARALDLLLTGRLFSGREAVELGLASRAVPREQVLPTALEIARDIAANCAPLSVAVSKTLVHRMLAETDPARAHDVEWAVFTAMGKMPDAAEGAASFMERRPPEWASGKDAVREVVDVVADV